MTFKTILVCLTDRTSAEKLTRFAAMVADKFDAHLIGVHAVPNVELHPAVGPYISEDMIERLNAGTREESEYFGEKFKSAVLPYACVSEWRSVRSRADGISQALTDHALSADLIVMAQPTDGVDTQATYELHRNLILGAGRPILVMPHYGTFETVGDAIILAWNGTRESSRAAHDSLPFLKRAKDVFILGIEGRGASEDDVKLGGHDLAASLARHGVKGTVCNFRKASISVSDELLNAVTDHGADMIVMGAYGHSRVYDFVLGAATSGVLAHMTVPTLFAN